MKLQCFFVIMMTMVLGGCGKLGTPVKRSLTGSIVDPQPQPLDVKIVAGGGEKVTGTGAMSVPVADAMVARIQNAIGVSSLAGNFRTALTQFKSNMPKSTDPTKATGFDSAQLVIYAACSDLTTGGTPLMTSRYQVNANGTIAANQNAMISAGVAMLDTYTAGLASQGPTASEVKTALTNLVSTIAGQAGATSRIAFMSVCIAANTAGAAMLGF